MKVAKIIIYILSAISIALFNMFMIFLSKDYIDPEWVIWCAGFATCLFVLAVMGKVDL